MGFYLSVIKTLSTNETETRFTIGGLTQFKKALSELAGFLYEWKLRDGFEGTETFYGFLDSDFNTIIEEEECVELLKQFKEMREDFKIDCKDKDHPPWMLERYDQIIKMLELAVKEDGRILFG